MNNPTTAKLVETLCDLAGDAYFTKYTDEASLLAAAADRLEALEAGLTESREQQRWIPVAERLPEKFESVLVYFDSGNMAVGFWYDVDECLSLWKVWIDDGWYSETDCEPVYWMPLPEAPKEETHESERAQ